MTTPTPWIPSTITIKIELNAEQLGIDGVGEFDRAVHDVVADAIGGMLDVNGNIHPYLLKYLRFVDATFTRGDDVAVRYAVDNDEGY